MNASATVSRQDIPAAIEPVRPMTMIDGVYEPRLRVEQFTIEGPLNERNASLIPVDDVPERMIERLQWATIDIVHPLRLVDGSLRMTTLVRGRVVAEKSKTAARYGSTQWFVEDEWKVLLSRPFDSLFFENDNGLLITRCGRNIIESAGNRSINQYMIAGKEVFVLRDGGEAWTLGQTVQFIASLADVNFSIDLLSEELRNESLPEDVNLAQPLRAVLLQLLQPFDLWLDRVDRASPSDTSIRFVLRDHSAGRRIHLPCVDRQQVGLLIEERRKRETTRAKRWVARANGKTIESTFNLLAAWDPSLEGQPDSTYSRVNNEVFATYANVYRAWALNEDGSLNDAPFFEQMFDLTMFFNDSIAIAPQPLRFDSCLTLDDAGRRRPTIVEISIDSGINWTAYEGDVVVSNDRAAVYFNDATLPDAFLAAAKIGYARVRITATVQSPQPFEVARWSGNPFHGDDEPRVVDVADAFAFTQVDSNSIHRPLIDSGAATAIENDPTQVMVRWLLDRMASNAGENDGISLTLTEPLPLLCIGDRVRPATMVAADQPFIDFRDEENWSVDKVECDWSASTTKVLLR